MAFKPLKILAKVAKGAVGIAGGLLGVSSGKAVSAESIVKALLPTVVPGLATNKDVLPETQFYETRKTKLGDILRPIIRPAIVVSLVFVCIKLTLAGDTIPYTIKWLSLICVPGYLGLKSIEKKNGTSSTT